MTVPKITTTPTTSTPLLTQQYQNKNDKDLSVKQQHNGQIVKILPLPYAGNGKLATIARDGRIHIWSSADISCLQSLDFSTKSSKDVPWPTDAILGDIQGQKRLIVSAMDRSLSIFNVLKAEEDLDRPDPSNCLGYAGKFIASASFGAVSALGSFSTSTQPGSMCLHSSESSIHGNAVLLGTVKGSLELLQSPLPSETTTKSRYALHPSNATHACTNDLQITTLDKTKTLRLHKEHSDSISQIIHIPDTGILTSSLDSTIKLFDPARNILKFSSNLHNSSVRCMDYDPALSICCSGGAERSVIVWHPNGDPTRAIGKLSGHVHGTVSIAFGHQMQPTASSNSPSFNHQVFTLSGHGTLTVWDLRTFQALQTIGQASWLRYDESHPVVMCFDQHNQCLVTGTRRPAIWKYHNTT